MAFTQEDYKALLSELQYLGDPKYKKFHEGLMPGVSMAYGVRVPAMRAIAKRIVKEDPWGFLSHSAPASYEETMLRGLVIASMPLPIGERLALTESFLPLIDNWALCDTFCGAFKLKKPQDREEMWRFLLPLFDSEEEFTARFAIVMFLGHFVTEDKIDEGLGLLEGLRQPQYYIQMAAAWAVCECYVKFPQKTLPLLKRQTLPPFTQNKAIQKIRESYRVPGEDKEMLLSYKLP